MADTRLPSDALRQSLFLQTISLESIYSLTGEMRREVIIVIVAVIVINTMIIAILLLFIIIVKARST